MALTRRAQFGNLQRYRPRGLESDIPVSAGEHTIRVNTQILLAYLPAIASFTFDSGIINQDGIDLNVITFRHPQHRLPHQYKETMLDALEVLLKSLAMNVDKSESTSLELTNWLEKSVSSRLEIRNRRTARAHMRFHCLAFIGQIYRSPRIQALVSQFFVKQCRRLISDEDDEVMILRWCHTIVACLNSAERVGCLRELIMNRDDVLRDLRVALRHRGHGGGEEVLRAVQEVLVRMSLMRQMHQTRDHDDFDLYNIRGRQSQRGGTNWAIDDLNRPRLSRHISDSPPQWRGAMQPWGNTRGSDLDLTLRSLQIRPRRRAMSQENFGDHERLKRLERRLHEVEDAVTFVGMRRLNLAGFDYEMNDTKSDDFAFD